MRSGDDDRAMPSPLATFMAVASKWGPWAALALALVAFIAYQSATQVEAINSKLDKHMASQDRSVAILRIMCTAVVTTDAEREACRQAGEK